MEKRSMEKQLNATTQHFIEWAVIHLVEDEKLGWIDDTHIHTNGASTRCIFCRATNTVIVLVKHRGAYHSFRRRTTDDILLKNENRRDIMSPFYKSDRMTHCRPASVEQNIKTNRRQNWKQWQKKICWYLKQRKPLEISIYLAIFYFATEMLLMYLRSKTRTMNETYCIFLYYLDQEADVVPRKELITSTFVAMTFFNPEIWTRAQNK